MRLGGDTAPGVLRESTRGCFQPPGFVGLGEEFFGELRPEIGCTFLGHEFAPSEQGGLGG
jgi:hypothetical protein